jgi:hypothetical protein
MGMGKGQGAGSGEQGAWGREWGVMEMEPDVILKIDSIEDITDRGVCAILEGGKRIWLPERFCTPIPGALVVPGWLIRKIKRSRERGVGSRGQGAGRECNV